MLMEKEPVIGEVFDYIEPKRSRIDQCIVAGQWYVVNTEPRHEVLARGEIANAGLVAYVPTIFRSEHHGRGQKRSVERPMFPSYLFVKCEANADHWGFVTAARGVHRLLGCGGRPLAVDFGAIEVIRLYEAEELERERVRIRRDEASQKARLGGKSGIVWDFTADERVRIKEGPFRGFNALLEAAVDSHDRIRAVLSLFGRQSVVQLSAFDIEKL